MPEPIIYGPPEEEAVKLKLIAACKAWMASALDMDPKHVNPRYVASTQDPLQTSLFIDITELFKKCKKSGIERTPEVRNYLMETMKIGVDEFIAEGHFSHKIHGLTIVPNMVDYKKEKGEYRNWEL